MRGTVGAVIHVDPAPVDPTQEPRALMAAAEAAAGDGAPPAVLTVDGQGVVTYVSGAAEELA
ncbi:MAG: hypothetical protein KIT58_06615, partial [Planctomycetota bacterium]|nr:hypothetical protein [Planctomycetota bacterium]